MTAGELLVATFYAVMAATIVLAIRWGDRVERQAALFLLVLLVLQLGLRVFSLPRYETVDPRSLLVDTIGFVGFAWIGITCRRYWPLLASALEMIAVCAHLARASGLEVDPIVYAYMKSVPTFFVLVALLLGTLFYQRRRRRVLCARSSRGSNPTAPSRR